MRAVAHGIQSAHADRTALAPYREALLRTLQQAAPNAEFILWGAEDTALSRIHASDESVDPGEIERLVVAQALLLQRLTETPSA